MKRKKVSQPATKFGHGLNRASKTRHKEHTRTLKHKRRWVEDKMDNK